MPPVIGLDKLGCMGTRVEVSDVTIKVPDPTVAGVQSRTALTKKPNYVVLLIKYTLKNYMSGTIKATKHIEKQLISHLKPSFNQLYFRYKTGHVLSVTPYRLKHAFGFSSFMTSGY